MFISYRFHWPRQSLKRFRTSIASCYANSILTDLYGDHFQLSQFLITSRARLQLILPLPLVHNKSLNVVLTHSSPSVAVITCLREFRRVMDCHKQGGTVTAFPGFNAEDDCKKLRSAVKGLGTDEKAVIAVICYRSNAQRQELKVKYKSMYGKDLTDEMKDELGGDFRATILGLLLTPADFDATCVNKAVKGLGTDEAALIEVITSRSSEELQAMKASYKKLFGKEMEKAVASDLSGDFKRIMVSLICAHREPEVDVDTALAAKDAKTIYDAGEKVWGTDEATFNSIFATRSFGQLKAMYKEYAKISKNTIEIAIEKEMSGDLEKAYLAIVEVSKNLIEYFACRLYKSMKGLGTDENTLTRVMVSRCEVDMEQIKCAFQVKYGKSLYSFIKDDISGDYERTLLALCRD